MHLDYDLCPRIQRAMVVHAELHGGRDPGSCFQAVGDQSHRLIQQRKVGTKEVLNFEVSGEKIEAVHMLPGYTHNIVNLSETDDLVTLMWANECFDPKKPDTFFEVV